MRRGRPCHHRRSRPRQAAVRDTGEAGRPLVRLMSHARGRQDDRHGRAESRRCLRQRQGARLLAIDDQGRRPRADRLPRAAYARKPVRRAGRGRRRDLCGPVLGEPDLRRHRGRPEARLLLATRCHRRAGGQRQAGVRDGGLRRLSHAEGRRSHRHRRSQPGRVEAVEGKGGAPGRDGRSHHAVVQGPPERDADPGGRRLRRLGRRAGSGSASRGRCTAGSRGRSRPLPAPPSRSSRRTSAPTSRPTGSSAPRAGAAAARAAARAAHCRRLAAGRWGARAARRPRSAGDRASRPAGRA